MKVVTWSIDTPPLLFQIFCTELGNNLGWTWLGFNIKNAYLWLRFWTKPNNLVWSWIILGLVNLTLNWVLAKILATIWLWCKRRHILALVRSVFRVKGSVFSNLNWMGMCFDFSHIWVEGLVRKWAFSCPELGFRTKVDIYGFGLDWVLSVRLGIFLGWVWLNFWYKRIKRGVWLNYVSETQRYNKIDEFSCLCVNSMQ